MATVGRRVGRLDVRLVRGDSERLGGRWRQRYPDGTVKAVDLGAWSGVVELRSPDGERVVVFACVRGDDRGRVCDRGHPALRVYGRGVGGPADRPVEGHGHVAGRRDQAHAGLGLLRPVGLNGSRERFLI